MFFKYLKFMVDFELIIIEENSISDFSTNTIENSSVAEMLTF